MEKDCEYCFGQTATGAQCQRKASCHIGCKYFCWQHAKKYGGKVYKRRVSKSTPKGRCRDPDMQECGSCVDLKSIDYPCTIGYHSIMFNPKEYKEYCDLIGEEYFDVEKQRKLAKKKTQAWKKLKIPKKKTTKVHFK